MTDDLDRLLLPVDGVPTAGLRDRLRERTARRVRRRRYARFLRAASIFACCYVAGAATFWFARPSPEVRVVTIEKVVTPPEAPPPTVIESPRALELAAEQADGAEGSRLFLEAGRRYGRDWNDWQSALRCYRNALDLSSEAPVLDAINDDWLLAKLKTQRREIHANP